MPAGKTYIKIASYTVPSAVASYTFTNIPQNFTDLVLIASGKVDVASTTKLNVGNNSIDTGSNYSWNVLSGTGSAANSYRESGVTFTQNERYANWDATNTANTIIQIQNYSSGTVYKTWLSKGYNAATGVDIIVGLWRSTSAINQVRISATNATRNLAAGTTLTLYGIECAKSPYATGGDKIYSTGTHWVHEFYNSGLFVPQVALTVDYLVVGGGNTIGYIEGAGGGGGGGFRTSIGGTQLSLNASTGYLATVGAGGAGGSIYYYATTQGGSSTFSSITSAGGGFGAVGGGGGSGGSGGGGGGDSASRVGGSGNNPSTSPSQGNNGGSGFGHVNYGRAGGGGGGAGAVGGNASDGVGGNGGAGATSTITGSTVTYAGGGGGSTPGSTQGSGGAGGGGAGSKSGNATSGTVNTGGGGGGYSSETTVAYSGNGGSGIVIVRYPI